MALKAAYEPRYVIKGWFSPSELVEGWWDLEYDTAADVPPPGGSPALRMMMGVG